jgi:hypothetical protein
MLDKRLTELLRLWAEWCAMPSDSLGYPSTAAGIRFRPGNDFEAMCSDMDDWLAHAVDVSVDELPIIERSAVHTVVLGAAAWTLREPVQDAYGRARDMLKARLIQRGVE